MSKPCEMGQAFRSRRSSHLMTGIVPATNNDAIAMRSTITIRPMAKNPTTAPKIQLLRPTLGLRPWFALERRALAFFFWVRFDIGLSG